MLSLNLSVIIDASSTLATNYYNARKQSAAISAAVMGSIPAAACQGGEERIKSFLGCQEMIFAQRLLFEVTVLQVRKNHF